MGSIALKIDFARDQNVDHLMMNKTFVLEPKLSLKIYNAYLYSLADPRWSKKAFSPHPNPEFSFKKSHFRDIWSCYAL